MVARILKSVVEEPGRFVLTWTESAMAIHPIRVVDSAFSVNVMTPVQTNREEMWRYEGSDERESVLRILDSLMRQPR